MRKSLLGAAIAAGAFVLSLSAAQSGTLIPVPQVPGSTATDIEGINNNDQITGHYTTSDGINHGYVGTIDGKYTTFDYGNATDTEPRAVNDDGYITGFSLDTETQFYGDEFVRKPDGAMTTVMSAKRQGVPLVGAAEGITTHTNFVGDYWTTDGEYVAHGYYGKGHAYQADLVLPFSTLRTRPRGLNKYGLAVGWFSDRNLNGRYRGFMVQDGTATAIDYPDPNAFYVYIEDVNDKRVIAGYWQDVDLTFARAFLFNPETDAFKDINLAGTTYVYAGGINNAGLVTLNIDGAPYIYCSKKATCPQSPNAIEVPDRWIKAPPGSVHSVVCRNRCLRPAHLTGKKADPAVIREAIAHDPALRMEMGLHRAQ